MKGFLVLLAITASATAQFGNFGGLGDLAGGLAGRVAGGIPFVGSLPSLPIVSNVQTFSELLAQTGKSYATAAERTLHEGFFAASKTLVDSVNAANSGFKLAINAFADLGLTELLSTLTGNKKSSQGESKSALSRTTAQVKVGVETPDSYDWRQKGGVTPVKFQGTCGSCWSFATTGAIEGHVFRKTGKLMPLSEQNLIDCGGIDFGLDGCDGGYQEYAFAFITSQKGIARNDSYPYLDKKDQCKYNGAIKGAEIKAFATITPKDEKTMKDVIATLGPLACSVYGVHSLFLYDSGIYADEECNKGELNHSVLVVGYGSENGKDYWIVKNSWDKAWGEEGYFRLPRGNNFCGIASECSYPVL